MDEKKKYWATETDPEKFIKKARERFAWRIQSLRRNGTLRRASECLSAYYGRGVDGQMDTSRADQGGEQGEVTKYTINGVRPVVNTTIGLIFGNRPAVKPKAKDGGAQALAATRFATQLWDSFQTTLPVQDVELSTVRGGHLASEWCVGQAWANKSGEEWNVDPATGQVQYTGDIDLFTLPPWRVCWDQSSPEQEKRQWVMFRRPVSRWALVSRVDDEQLREKILNSTTGAFNEIMGYQQSSTSMNEMDELIGDNPHPDDVLWIYEFRHKPSSAISGGRLVRFIDPDVILYDSAAHGAGYPYDEKDLHVYEYSPERVVGGANGHTAMFDLLGSQRVLDYVTSAAASCVNLFSLPNIWQNKQDGKIDGYGLSSGLNVLESNSKPEMLQFDPPYQALISISEWIQSSMAQSAALNDTVMGNPAAGMPASAQALQRAQAVQFNAVSQAEAVKLVTRNANGILKLLQRFAENKRELRTAGGQGSYEVIQWNKASLEGVDCFTVEVVDPLSNSYERRQANAEMLIQMGNMKPEDMVKFMETGNLSSALEKSTLSSETIERNQDLLFKGIGLAPIDEQATADVAEMMPGTIMRMDDGKDHVVILRTDKHDEAIRSYLAVANSPSARLNRSISDNVLNVVNETMRLWASLTPDECVAYGVPMLPSQQAAMAAPPMPPPGMPGGEPMAPGAPAMPEEPGADIGLPKPPANPITGEESGQESVGL